MAEISPLLQKLVDTAVEVHVAQVYLEESPGTEPAWYEYKLDMLVNLIEEFVDTDEYKDWN